MELKREEPQPEMSLTAIDLFCGGGGFSLGLKWADFNVRAALDNDPAAIKTYAHNFGDIVLNVDASLISSPKIRSKAQIDHDDITLVVGGPPCQGFSIQRRGDRNDERNNLVKVFLDIALDLRPKFFIIENVLGLVSRHGREIQGYVQDAAAMAGYACHTAKLNAASYCVPQVRWRVFIVGERLDHGIGYFKFPQPDREPDRYMTVREALRDLPSPPEDGSCHPFFTNHYREARLSELNLRRIAAVPEGGGREHLPAHLQLPCHVNNKNHRHLDVYGRLAWDRPSVTITARFDSFTRGRFGHPTENRTLTLREGARLQSFPDSFQFFGNREEVARQIGNAVPPLLARRLGQAIRDAIQRRIAQEPAVHSQVSAVQYLLI